MGSPQGTPTVVPVISTWTSGTSTWTATDHWSTVYGGAAGGGAGPAAVATPAPSGTAWAAANGSSSYGSTTSTDKPSKPEHTPNKSRLAAMAIMSARSKAVAAQASAGSTTVGATSQYLGPNDGSWVLPSSGQIFAGGQDVTLSWRSVQKPPDSTTLSLCLLKNEGDLRAVQSGIQNNGACGSSTTPTVIAGAQPGIWTISFTAPNVTSADSFYVLLSKSVGGSSSSGAATSTKSAAKAAQSAKDKKKQDRKDRDDRKYRSGSGSADDDSEGGSGSDDDEGSYEGDEDDGYSSRGNSVSYRKEKGWSSLLRERSVAGRRSHEARSDDSGSGSSSSVGSVDNASGSMLSPAFVLAPYGSDTNPAAVQSLASTGSSFGNDGSDSLAVAPRPGVSVTAVLIPCLLAAMALVGALALLMYRRGRSRAKEEADRVRAAETSAREKAKSEMREFLRRSPTNATSVGAYSLYHSGKSDVHYMGGSLPPSRRSYTPTPSYRSHGHPQQQYGFSKHPDFERPTFGYSHAAEYQTKSVPYAHYQSHDSVPIRMGNERLQARDSLHSSSGKSFASASSGPIHMDSRPASVRVAVPTGPTPPPPVHAPTPPLPPPTPPKDHPSLYQRYHPQQQQQQQQHEGIPLVRSGSAGGAGTPPVGTMGAGMAPHPYHQPVAVAQTTMNGQVPAVTFTSPTASSPNSSLWARVTNPFNVYAQAAQASLPVTQSRSSPAHEPSHLTTSLSYYAQPQATVAFGPGSAANLVRPIPTASIPMIQPPIPALVSPPLVQHQRLTMMVPTAMASETVPASSHAPESIPNVLRNGSLKNLGQPF